MATVTLNRSALAYVPDASILHDPTMWYSNVDHFGAYGSTTDLDLRYTTTQVTSGTVAFSTTERGGILTIDSGGTTAGRGINFQHKLLTIDPETNLPSFVEWRVRFDAFPTALQFFAGLAVIDTTIISGGATGVNSASAAIGFQLTTASQTAAAGKLQAVCISASTATTLTADNAIIEDVWYILSAKVTGKEYVDFFIRIDDPTSTLNGTEYPIGRISTNVPSVPLSESIVVQTNGTSQPIVSVDMFRAAQAIK